MLLAATMLGSGGSGNGGGENGGGGRQSGLCISFQATGAPAASRVVATPGPGSQCNLAEVVVELTGVSDVLTVSFEVAFDPLVAKYAGYSLAGSHMSSGGASVNVQEKARAGSILLGVTRLNQGIDFTQTGTVIKLKFSAVSSSVPATGNFTFSNTQVLGSEAPPKKKSGIQWSNGTLVVG